MITAYVGAPQSTYPTNADRVQLYRAFVERVAALAPFPVGVAEIEVAERAGDGEFADQRRHLHAHGVDFTAMGHMAGVKAAQILNGTHAGAIPVEDAADYAIVFNLKRALGLGIEIPKPLLTAADQVYKAEGDLARR